MPSPDPIAIIQLRQRVLNASAAEQPHIRAAFAQSFPAWADATAWTFRVKEVGGDGRNGDCLACACGGGDDDDDDGDKTRLERATSRSALCSEADDAV